jgi:integrase
VAIKLTTQGIAKAVCPPDRAEAKLPIEGHKGAYLRIRNGAKSILVLYRDAAGKQRWWRVCDARVAPKDIAEAIQLVRGRIVKGDDPAGERARARSYLEAALEAYEKDLTRRHVVKRGEVMSLLRRELARPLGNVDLAAVTRNDLVQRIAAVERSGRPGAARELRKVAAVFLGWCADTGLIDHSPLAGYRRQRKTRAQRLDRAGRALADWELPLFWQAAKSQGWPFGPYLQILLLLGQRRTETAAMRWRDLDLERGIWTIPASVTKSGRVHRVPLPPQAIAILARIPRTTSALVFPGRGNAVMSGWSKRLTPLYRATSAAGMPHFTIHDLRRTMRTGLGQLGVDRVVAELLLNHAVSDELTQIYDRADYWQQRVDAAGRWADHVTPP